MTLETFQRTSEAFRITSSFDEPVFIDRSLLDKVADLKNRGIIPQSLSAPTFNQHAELNIGIHPMVDIRTISKHVNKITTSDNVNATPEKEITTIDLYYVDKVTGTTVRQRYTKRDGKLYDIRVLISLHPDKSETIWKSSQPDVMYTARTESIVAFQQYSYVDQDMTEQRKLTRSATAEILLPLRNFSHVVIKHKIPIHFGEAKMWKHIPAVTVGGKSIVHQSESSPMFGVDDYLVAAVQESRIARVHNDFLGEAEMFKIGTQLSKGILQPESCFNLFAQGMTVKSSTSMEIESRGKYDEEAANITTQSITLLSQLREDAIVSVGSHRRKVAIQS